MTPHRLEVRVGYQLTHAAAAFSMSFYRRFTFDSFTIGNEDSNYALYVGGGDVPNNIEQLSKFVEEILASNGTGFSTRDRDHDSVDENCALNFNGGWWYNECEPNSFPHEMYGENIEFVVMRIKPWG